MASQTLQRKPSSADDEMQPPGGVVQGGFIGGKVSTPLSTGHLELRNKNPRDNPSVTFNYFKEPADPKTCVKGMKIISKVLDGVIIQDK